MNVLSLFDGMSCTQLALKKADIPVTRYFASEVDKYAIKVTQANFPETIQLGDVRQVTADQVGDIDLLVGGSPCQGFSFAGKRLAFDDPRSALFFEFVRCLKEINPRYFLLENVRMKQEHLNVISDCLEVEPICINSALVSAQNRVRYYWTNISGIEKLEDKGIVLRDILETHPDNYTLMSDKFAKRQEGRKCLVDMNKEKSASLSAMEYVKNGRQGDYLACEATGIPKDLSETYNTPKQIGIATDINGHDILKRVYSPEGKSPTLNSMGGGNREPKVLDGASRERYEDDGTVKQHLKLRQGGKTNSLTTVQKDNVVTRDEVYWRKLTPVECERLQTVPDNYTNHVSNSQRYRMLGNGMTVDVIASILEKIKTNNLSQDVMPSHFREEQLVLPIVD